MPNHFSKAREDKEFENSADVRWFPEQNRTLHVHFENWKCRTARIMDQDKETLLYEVDVRNRRPQLTVRRTAADNKTAGTVNFHPMTRKMESTINDHTFKLKGKNWKYCDLQWESPAFGCKTLTWKRKTMWVVLDFVLLDENQMPIAKFCPSGMSFKKACTIELMDGEMSPEQLDEIVTTGLAVYQDTVYYTSINAGAAAA